MIDDSVPAEVALLLILDKILHLGGVILATGICRDGLLGTQNRDAAASASPLLLRAEQSKFVSSLAPSYLQPRACTPEKLVKLSALRMSYFSDILHNAQSLFFFSQCTLWQNGADGAASHPQASELLRVLNLPQHTGTLRSDETVVGVHPLPFCDCGYSFNTT